MPDLLLEFCSEEFPATPRIRSAEGARMSIRGNGMRAEENSNA
jgi:hypothetical protein